MSSLIGSGVGLITGRCLRMRQRVPVARREAAAIPQGACAPRIRAGVGGSCLFVLPSLPIGGGRGRAGRGGGLGSPAHFPSQVPAL